MINFLLNAIYRFLEWLISLLPDFGGLPEGMESSFTLLSSYWGMFDVLIPMDTLSTAISIVLTVELVYFGYRMVMKIAQFIPTLNVK